jgi:hypothetical protein
MLGKRLGKHNFGFMEDPKGKGKERKAAGAAKVNCPCMKLLISSDISTRVFVLLPVVISVLAVLRRGKFICGICNRASDGSHIHSDLVLQRCQHDFTLVQQNEVKGR